MATTITIKTKTFFGKIEIDANNFAAYELTTIKDKEAKNYGLEVANELGYYNSMKHCIHGIVQKAISNSSDEVLLMDFIKKYEQITFEMQYAIKVEVDKLTSPKISSSQVKTKINSNEKQQEKTRKSGKKH